MRIITTAAAAALAAAALAVSLPQADAATRLQKTFGNWKVDCTEREANQKNCSLQYSLVTKKDKRVVFSWTIIRRGKDDPKNMAVLRTPTGVLLADGVNVGFEGADPVKISYLTCGANGCVAEFDFTDQWVKALGSNPKVTVNYKSVNEKPIKHDVDLKQFATAFDFFVSQVQAKQ